MTEQEELERARLAREVLENPVFRETFERMEKEILAAWQVEKDEKSREWLWSMNRAAKRVESVLTEAMNSGKFREKQIQLAQTRIERAGKTLRTAFGR